MAEYKIAFKASVDKDLTNLPKNLVARVWQRFEHLKQQPFPKQALKLEGSEGLYRLRVGDYRIIYVSTSGQGKFSFTMFGIDEKCIEPCSKPGAGFTEDGLTN